MDDNQIDIPERACRAIMTDDIFKRMKTIKDVIFEHPFAGYAWFIPTLFGCTLTDPAASEVFAPYIAEVLEAFFETELVPTDLIVLYRNGGRDIDFFKEADIREMPNVKAFDSFLEAGLEIHQSWGWYCKHYGELMLMMQFLPVLPRPVYVSYDDLPQLLSARVHNFGEANALGLASSIIYNCMERGGYIDGPDIQSLDAPYYYDEDDDFLPDRNSVNCMEDYEAWEVCQRLRYCLDLYHCLRNVRDDLNGTPHIVIPAKSCETEE